MDKNQQHGRGLFRQQYAGPAGNEVITVVDRYDRCLATITVPERADRNLVNRSLRSLLSVLDPKPALEVVQGAGGRPELVN